MPLQDPLFDPSAGNPRERAGASARSARRNAQRRRTMMGHPSGAGGPAAGAPEGQLFDTDPFLKAQTGAGPSEPTWGKAHGRPRMHSDVTGAMAPPKQGRLFDPDDPDDESKFWNARKNLQGQQFGSRASQVVGSITEGLARSDYYRKAGMGAALRYTFNLPQIPSHVNDYLNAQQKQKNRGVNPQGIDAEHEVHTGYDF